MTFQAAKLSNGMHVLTYHMPNLQTVAINLVVKVGSRNESIEESGLSHFLEHMAFKGTKTRTARQIAEEFDSIGGHFNAYTGKEQTVFYSKVLSENFIQALEIIADILQNSSFNKEDIEKEYQVICQEIAQVFDNPDDLAYEKFTETAYPNQSLGRSILGSSENIATFTSKSFRSYLTKYYKPENMYLSIAGNINHNKVLQAAERFFSNIQGQKEQNNFFKANYIGGSSLIAKKLEQSTLILGFESASYLNLSEFYHSQILSLILGGGISSRLFQHIRENLGLAYSVGTYNSSYFDSGLFSIYTATSHENLTSLAENLIVEIKKAKDKISEEELSRAKSQIKASLYMAEEKSAYKSEEIGKNYAIFGKYTSIKEILEYVMNTSTSDIENVAAKIFTTKPTLSAVGLKPQELDYEEICKNLSQ